MDGRAFLDVARELAQRISEAHWRTAAGRAYYSLMLTGRDMLEDWGFPLPPRDQVHHFVRARFTYSSDSDLKEVGLALDRLVTFRNRADYQLAASALFTSAIKTLNAIREAGISINRLDQVNSDPARRSAAIADIRAKFP